MKKIIWSLIISLLWIPTIYAKEYTIENYRITINIPDDWTTFTRDNLENNPELKDIKPNELKQLMEQQYMYIDAVKEDMEFVLRIRKNDLINNLANYSQKDKEELGKELQKKASANNYKILENNGLTLIQIEYKDQGFYLLEFYTIVNQNGFTFTTQKLTQFTDNEKKEIEQLVKSAQIQVQKEFEKEKNKESGIKSVITYAIIGGIIGGTIGGIIDFIRKKKKNENSKNS